MAPPASSSDVQLTLDDFVRDSHLHSLFLQYLSSHDKKGFARLLFLHDKKGFARLLFLVSVEEFKKILGGSSHSEPHADSEDEREVRRDHRRMYASKIISKFMSQDSFLDIASENLKILNKSVWSFGSFLRNDLMMCAALSSKADLFHDAELAVKKALQPNLFHDAELAVKKALQPSFEAFKLTKEFHDVLTNARISYAFIAGEPMCPAPSDAAVTESEDNECATGSACAAPSSDSYLTLRRVLANRRLCSVFWVFLFKERSHQQLSLWMDLKYQLRPTLESFISAAAAEHDADNDVEEQLPSPGELIESILNVGTKICDKYLVEDASAPVTFVAEPDQAMLFEYERHVTNCLDTGSFSMADAEAMLRTVQSVSQIIEYNLQVNDFVRFMGSDSFKSLVASYQSRLLSPSNSSSNVESPEDVVSMSASSSDCSMTTLQELFHCMNVSSHQPQRIRNKKFTLTELFQSQLRGVPQRTSLISSVLSFRLDATNKDSPSIVKKVLHTLANGTDMRHHHALPDHVEAFFCPSGANIIRARSKPEPKLFHMTIGNADKAFYGACLTRYVPLEDDSQLGPLELVLRETEGLEVFIPVGVCIVSRYPILNTLKQRLEDLHVELQDDPQYQSSAGCSSIVVVDLDTNTMSSQVRTRMPEHLRTPLVASLQQLLKPRVYFSDYVPMCLPSSPQMRRFPEARVRECFRATMQSLLQPLDEFRFVLSDDFDYVVVFDQVEYLRRVPAEDLAFCRSFLETQLFSHQIASVAIQTSTEFPLDPLGLLRDANAPVIGLNMAGHVIFWNRRLEAITGVLADDILGRSVHEVVTGGDARHLAVDQALAHVLDTGESVPEVPLLLRTSTGQEALVKTSLTAFFSERGEEGRPSSTSSTVSDGEDAKMEDELGVERRAASTPVGVYGIGQDLSQQWMHEKQYESVIMQANAPIIELDREAVITVWNAKTASLTGLAREAVVGTPLMPMVDAEHRALVADHIHQTLATGVAGDEFELPLITATGARVEISLCLTPRFDAGGALVGVVAIGQDVTERNAKEMEYRKFIDSANAPIFCIDNDGRIVIFNKKAAETSEYSAEEVMGVKIIDALVSEEYREAVAAVFDKASLGIETASVEFPLITKTGRKVEILLNATPRYDHLGNLCGVIGIGQDITDRIIQEQEYSRLIDTANAPIFGVDRDFDVIIWNKKAASITQYTNEDTMGEDLLKFISVEYRNAVQEVLSKALNGIETANFEFPLITKSANFEFPLITKSGRRLDILLNATPKYDHFGNICGVVGIGQDITDRRAQEQEYTRLIDTANAPIFGVDRELRVNIWNRKAAQITEYSVFDVLGANLVENFIPQEYKQEVGGVLSKALEGIETANFEFPLITRTGRRLEILLNATPRYDEKGAIIGVVGIGQDITVRIAQEQEYSRLIDTANAPIFGVDMKGQVNIWNKKAAEITQYSTEDVIGKDLVNRFVSEENRSAVGFALRKALQGAQTANFDFPLITKAGRRVEILLNATPRYNELGNIVGVVGIGQDITERIAQEQEYTRLIDKANAPIFGVDVNGCLNIWNRKAAEITQYTTEEETANFEFPLITKAGRRVEILLNATCRYNEHGGVIGMVGIGQDITDRIAQEQEYSRLIDTANAPIFGVDEEGRVNIWNDITDRIAQEQEYSRLIDTANAPIFGVDEEGRVNIWNVKAAEITQYTPSDVMGANLVEEFITEDYREAVGYVLSKALHGTETANFEFPLITKAGRRVEILLNATPRFNERGKVMGMVGIGQDITDRIAQEQEYTRLIDKANAPIFGVDVNGCLNIWNRKAAEITQYTTEETANFEFPLITRPGTRIEILLNATPRMDSNGNIVGVVGIGQDITDRIAQEHEYYRLIDTANAPIFGVDTNGCINVWNQKIEEITGYHKSSVLGLSLVNTFIIPESRQMMELPMTTKKGVFLLLLVNASSKKDMHGNIRGVIGVGQDYTARKHMEAAKVNFLASFSHELRTPLNGVLGMLEMLKDKSLEPESMRFVQIAYVSGSLLLNLINDILDLSKIEAGHMEITAAPFRMEELLDYSIEIFSFKARERGLNLEKKRDDNVPRVVIGDVVRLPRILIVEDNEFNWEVIKCFLQEDDHLLQWEKNGRDAVNAYIQHHNDYDLVFMDCEMPVMDGYAATTMMRQFEMERCLPRIPVLGLTAYAMNGDRQKCLDAGMDEFMIPEGDPVNYALGVQQCDGQEELFVNLLEKFAMGCDNSVAKIETAYQQRDIVVMRREAHSLKGSSASS
ncbi:hypothetical protein ATCC90586_006654 [Pythium insidiosum]|nr:hypothetical protein ATCC90586_006654 [Pythium insidiosum]